MDENKLIDTKLKRDELKSELSNLISLFLKNGKKLEEKTDNKYAIADTIDENIISIKNFLDMSPIVQELDRQMITYNFSRLKNYLFIYQGTYNVDTTSLQEAIDLYNYLLKIRQVNNQIETLTISYLSNLIDRSYLLDKNEYIYESKGKLIKKAIKLSDLEINNNRICAEQYLKQSKNKLNISDDIYNESLELLDDLFDGYSKKEILYNEDIKTFK